jgi:hypothetical protein
MSEDLKLFPEPEVSQESEGDVSSFWDESGLPEGIEVQDYYRKLIVLNFLDNRLAPTRVMRDPRGVPSEKVDIRNAAIRNLQVANTEQEASIAAEGLGRRLEKANRTEHGSPERAVTGTYNAAVKYWKDSKDRLDILKKALAEDSQTEPLPDPEIIKQLITSDPAFRNVYVDYFLHKENLDHYSWRKNQKNRKKFFNGAVIEVAQYLEPDRLMQAHTAIRNDMVRRLNFWSGQLSEAGRLDYVQVLRNPSSNLETLTAASSVTGESLESEIGEEAYNMGQLAVEQGLSKALSERSDKVRQTLEAAASKYEGASQRIDTQVQQGVPTHLAELRVLGTPAIRDEDGRIIGQEPPDERRTKIDAYSTGGRPKPRRSGFGHKADMEQNDPKVKDTYSTPES